MSITFWLLVFIVSLTLLVRGSHWFLMGAERIGVRLGLSPFAVGVIIVAVGTSFPELVSAIAAVMQGVPEVVIANVVGSNIANILLVIGTVAVLAKTMVVTKDLIDLELPILTVSTILFLGIVFDGAVTFAEALFLLGAYLIYFFYSLSGNEKKAGVAVADKSKEMKKIAREEKREGRRVGRFIEWIVAQKEIGLFVVGLLAVVFGARYLIESVIAISEIAGIAPEIISLSAIALGTSLPELFVSGRAVLSGKAEVAVGNVLGSNAFNALMVTGLPGLFATLPADTQTLAIGIPFVAMVTLLFVISGISRRLYHWEGLMFLALYAFFMLKIFGLI